MEEYTWAQLSEDRVITRAKLEQCLFSYGIPIPSDEVIEKMMWMCKDEEDDGEGSGV